MIQKKLCALLIVGCGAIQSVANAQGQPEVIDKIIDQGKNHSQVMQYLDHLAVDIGPRLTGSSRCLQANAWTRDAFAAMGLSNVHLFKWGDIPVGFDRGVSKVRMVKPVEQEFEFTTRSWSAGTNGPVKGPVIKQPKDMEELTAMGDKLKGVWVLAKPQQRGRFQRGGGGGGAEPGGSGPASGPARPDAANGGPPPATTAPADRETGPAASRPGRQGPGVNPDEPLIKAMYEAGILGRISPSGNELVVTSGASNWRELDFKKLPTEVGITIRRADYDAINSRLADGEEVIVEADLQHHFVEGPLPVSDTIAEIPGTEHPEQVIIVSGHLDSWDGPGSQGAQDNGVGSSTTLETARILSAAGVKPKRTIRFCLWTGEEEGLLGSKAYVKALSDEEKANISAVFVDDGGTNYDGGLQCVAAMEAMLSAAVAPVNKAFPDMAVKVNVRSRMPRGGASDHASFNQVGIPGFFWDEVGSGGKEGKNYTFVHHTQYDTVRYVVPEYLVQSATCAAVTAYNLAMADTLLPRYVPPVEKDDSTPESGAEFIITQGPLSGTWEGSMNRPAAEGSPPASSGGVGNPAPSGRGMGESKIANTTFDPKTQELKWKVRSEMMGTISFSAKVDGETMTGTMSNEDNDFSLPFKATRSEKQPVPATAEKQPAEAKPVPVEKAATGAGS